MTTNSLRKRNLTPLTSIALVAATAIGVGLGIAGGARQAHAAAAAADAAAQTKQDAKAEFNQGNVAYNLGKYPDAIAHFEKAYGLSRVPEILFNLGQCYRKLWEAEGKSELGRRALHYYQALAREAPQSRVRADADQFVAELEPAVVLAEARERQGLIDSARGAEALHLAQTFLRDGRLAEAASTADRLLREPDNSRELLAEAYVVRGRTAARLGDPLGAEAHFRRALELRPSAELTDAAATESAAFEAARRTMKGPGLRLVQAPAGEATPGKPLPLALTVEGDSEQLVSALELGYRRGDGGAFVTSRVPYAAAGAGDVPPPNGGSDAARVPDLRPRAAALVVPGAVLTPGARIEYYARALDAHGSTLAESGTPTLPFRIQVAAAAPALAEGVAGAAAGAPAAPGTPWFKRWWVWTIVGAVALGSGAAVYAGTRGGDGLTTYQTPAKNP